MTKVRPYVGFVTVVDVDHEDAKRKIDVGIVGHMFGGEREITVEQGIQAGVIVEVSDNVPHLEPGNKIYYPEETSVEIGDVRVVHCHRIIAWEES